jgi:hypothetical protein
LREIHEGNKNIDQDDAECRRRKDGGVEGCQGEKRKVGKKVERIEGKKGGKRKRRI